MERTDLDAREPTLFRCPFCHDDVNPASEIWIACGACLARHHSECWSEANACSSCKNPSPLVPVAGLLPVRVVRGDDAHQKHRRIVARRRRWLLGITLGVLVLVNLIFIAWWICTGSPPLPFSYNGF
jgi:hypothetical protein